MTFARPEHSIDTDTLPRMPAWVTSARVETLEDVAFLSGAALNHLHVVLGCAEVPQALLRERLALCAAEACVAFSGRRERAGELRDAAHLLRPGDLPGPAGETYLIWRRAVERPVAVKALGRALSAFEPGQIATWLDAGVGAPVKRAALVLEAVLREAPRADEAALILADAALAQALGWDHVVPLLAAGLKRADLRKQGDELKLACHRALVSSAAEAVRLSTNLARRAAHLKAVGLLFQSEEHPLFRPGAMLLHGEPECPVGADCALAPRRVALAVVDPDFLVVDDAAAFARNRDRLPDVKTLGQVRRFEADDEQRLDAVETRVVASFNRI